MAQKILFIIVGIIVLVGAGGTALLAGCQDDWCYVFVWQKIRAADSFERCAQLGFPVAESSPRQCRAGEKSFTEALPPPPASDMIRVTTPIQNALIESPLAIQGEARGGWYFEASFSIHLLDRTGKEIASGHAEAQSDWMTTEFVPFKATLVFTAPETDTGMLILEKDNPSGLPEHAASISIPVRFIKKAPAPAGTGTLQGTMTIGPLCPVEQVNNPCKPTPEMFAARKVSVYKKDRATLIVALTPDAEGKFDTILPEGEYWVDTAHPSGPGGISGVPVAVHITAGTAVMLTIDIDTGIR